MGQSRLRASDRSRAIGHFLPVLAIVLGLACTAALGRLASATWSLMQETARVQLADQAGDRQDTGEPG